MQFRKCPPDVAVRSKNTDKIFLEPIVSSVTAGVPLSTCPFLTQFFVGQFPVLIVSVRVGDFAALAALYKTAAYLDGLITPEVLKLPHPFIYCAAKFSIWAIYTFWAGLVGTGLWIIAHECGHQAFSESKFLNDAVGWLLHSG